MTALTVKQAAESITGLARQHMASLPKEAIMQVSDMSLTGYVSVTWRDHGGYPLFAVNVDLQKIPSARQRLQQALSSSLTFLTSR